MISIGLVEESGEAFYAELLYDRRRRSEFVLTNVIPHFGSIPDSKVRFDEIYGKLTEWLRLVRPTGDEIHLCYDFQADWDIFAMVLKERVPKWIKGRLVVRAVAPLLITLRHEISNLRKESAMALGEIGCAAALLQAEQHAESPSYTNRSRWHFTRSRLRIEHHDRPDPARGGWDSAGTVVAAGIVWTATALQ